MRTRRRRLLVATLVLVAWGLFAWWFLTPARTPASLDTATRTAPEQNAPRELRAHLEPAAPPRPPPTAPAPAKRDERPAIEVEVRYGGAPAAGASVQFVARLPDKPGRVLAGPANTGEEGRATLPLADTDGGECWVQAVMRTESVYRRLAASVDARTASSGGRLTLTFPAGGEFQIDLSGLPPEARPVKVEVSCFPPNEAHRAWLPPGVDEPSWFHAASAPVPELQRPLELEVGPDGLTVPWEAPVGYVVSPRIEPRETGWAATGVSYDGPLGARGGATPMFGVRAGARTIYRPTWRRAPALRVTVRAAEDGRPLPQAQVFTGVRAETMRRRTFHGTLPVNERGEAVGHLALRSPLPKWPLERAEVVVVVTHPGRVTQIQRLPFSWERIDFDVRMPASDGATWTVSGRVLKPSGESAAGARVTIAPSVLPDGGQFAVADAEGAFTLEADEQSAPLFLASEHFEVNVDPLRAGGEGEGLVGIPQRDRPLRVPLVREPGKQPPLTITLERVQ